MILYRYPRVFYRVLQGFCFLTRKTIDSVRNKKQLREGRRVLNGKDFFSSFSDLYLFAYELLFVVQIAFLEERAKLLRK